MAGTEISVPPEQFTKSKEPELITEKALEEEEEGVCRARAHPSSEELEAESTHGALQAKIPGGELEVLLAIREEGEKHILTLQTVHLTSEDAELQDLAPQRQEEVQAGSGLQSWVWRGDGSQQSPHPCVTISIQEEVYLLQEVEVMQLHVLEEKVTGASEGSRCAVSLAESCGSIKVQLALIKWGAGEEARKLFFRVTLHAVLCMDQQFKIKYSKNISQENPGGPHVVFEEFKKLHKLEYDEMHRVFKLYSISPLRPLMLSNYSLSILVAMDNLLCCFNLCFSLWILWFHQSKELNQAVINITVLV